MQALVESWSGFREACPEGSDPAEQPSLAHLPFTFYRYVAGLAALVDAFLGLPGQCFDISLLISVAAGSQKKQG